MAMVTIPREVIEKVCEKFQHTMLVFDPEGKITQNTFTLNSLPHSEKLVKRFFSAKKEGFYCVVIYSHPQKTVSTPAGMATYRIRVQNGKITDTEYGGNVGFMDFMTHTT